HRRRLRRRYGCADASGIGCAWEEETGVIQASLFLPKGFHRIRHYGLLTNGAGTRAEKLARARELIAAAGQLAPPPQPPQERTSDDTTLSQQLDHPCPLCGSPMPIVETFEPSHRPRPSAKVIVINMNTS